MERLGYRPALDGVRAIAIVAVVIYHLGYVPGGFFGVDLFFVLSGFLITTLLLEEHSRRGTFSLRDFYVRRVRRLYPALVVMVAVSVVAVTIVGGANVVPTDTAAIFGLGYVINIALASHHLIYHDAFIHLWSLAEEEQFYLLWPPVLLVLLRGISRPVIALMLAGLSLAAQLHIRELHVDNWRLYMGPDTHALPLVVGCLLAFGWRRLPISSLTAVLALAVFAWVARHATNTPFATLHYGTIVTAASCVIILGALHARLLGGVLGSPPLAYVGRLSYGIYLWHVPLFYLLPHEPLVAVAIAVAAAALSYRYVERPFRVRRRARVVELPAAVQAAW